MPHVLIYFPGRGPQLLTAEAGSLVIGRDVEADIVLPNVAVSRSHARLTLDAAGAQLEDLHSRNGLEVNGAPFEGGAIHSGDDIRIGKFRLVYLSEDHPTHTFEGRHISYLPAYQRLNAMSAEDTFDFGVAFTGALQVHERTLKHARVVPASHPSEGWRPMNQPLVFGGDGKVPVGGLLSGAPMARIMWDGKAHVFEKIASLARVKVNGESVQRKRLSHGDELRVGGSFFTYQIPEDAPHPPELD